MRVDSTRIVAAVLICLFILTSSCSKADKISLWERKCEACHDGRTKLAGKVVIDREHLKAKYSSLGDFINACDGSPACMNIFKHDKELFRAVGKELGIPETP